MSQTLVEYFNGDDLAAQVLENKYLLHNKEGELVETHPDQMHERLAAAFADQHEQNGGPLSYEEILNLFKDFKGIIPQGSVMSMLDNPFRIGSLSNCIVLEKPYDSYGGIFKIDQQLAQLMKRRCGVGVDISTLRPAGDVVENSAGTTTGAVSFMDRFSRTTEEVAQNGRRGALMLTIADNHPDVFQFVKIKRDLSKVTGANISIQLSDKFLQAVRDDADHDLVFGGMVYDTVKARDLWNEIIQSAWECAEPGLIFADTHHNYSPSHYYPGFKDITTNPCSEIMMGHDSCRLLVVNMFDCVDNPFTPQATFNFSKWKKRCEKACWIGDDLVDLEAKAIHRILTKIEADPEPEEVKEVEIRTWLKLLETGQNGRRVGIGFTGMGDTLAALGVVYDSDDGINFIDDIMYAKLDAELKAQAEISAIRGPFPAWDPELDEQNAEEEGSFWAFVKESFPERFREILKYGRRSISWSTVAPTGTVSMMTQTTSGIEPLFMPFYTRRRKINPDNKDARVDFIDQNGVSWMEYPVLHPRFKQWLESFDSYSDYVGHKFVQDLTSTELEKLFKVSPWYGSTAADIDWKKRVEIQGVIQKYTTHSISSTVNLPAEATLEDVATIYDHAWGQGLKGITVYRDGSRSGVLVSNKQEDPDEEFQYHDAPKRPQDLPCDIYRLTAEGQKWIVLVGKMNDIPFEVFALPADKFKVKTGYSEGTLRKTKSKVYNLIIENGEQTEYENIAQHMSHQQENVTRLVSLSLRHGANPKHVVEQLDKADGPITAFFKAISRTLKKNYVSAEDQQKMVMKNCPEDGSQCNIVLQEGCATCLQCGNSKCS